MKCEYVMVDSCSLAVVMILMLRRTLEACLARRGYYAAQMNTHQHGGLAH